MSYIYGYVGGSGVISGGMTGGAKMNRDMVTRELVDKIEAEAHGFEELRLEKRM